MRERKRGKTFNISLVGPGSAIHKGNLSASAGKGGRGKGKKNNHFSLTEKKEGGEP